MARDIVERLWELHQRHPELAGQAGEAAAEIGRLRAKLERWRHHKDPPQDEKCEGCRDFGPRCGTPGRWCPEWESRATADTEPQPAEKRDCWNCRFAADCADDPYTDNCDVWQPAREGE